MMWSAERPDAQRALNLPGVKKVLPRYVGIVEGKKYPKHMIAKSIEARFSRRDDLNALWKLHNQLNETYLEVEEQVKRKPRKVTPSYYELKILIAHRLMQGCVFCQRYCKADRLHGDRGYCGAGRNFSMFSAFPHMGEEPELVPSGTIFTGGCSIKCIHCQNWDISQWNSQGDSLTPEMMGLQVNMLAEAGCRNINMVGGDPTPYVWHWLEAFRYVKHPIATIWNSNSWYSHETALLLAGFIDLYLLDFKYGNNECAKELSDAPGYWEAATSNHLLADKYGEIITRVLVLPGHNECCTRPILEWIYDNLGADARVNLMFQYRPEWQARKHPHLDRRLSLSEKLEAKKIAQNIGLTNLVE